MGLYLCIFDGDEDIEGVEVGHYSDWSDFVEAVSKARPFKLLTRKSYKLLTEFESDRTGWSTLEAVQLREILKEISEVFKRSPPVPIADGWKRDVVNSFGLRIESLYDCFFDVDGEPLIARLDYLCEVSIRVGQPILFQ